MAKEGTKNPGTLLWSITAVIVTWPLYFLFSHFGEPGNGRAAWLCLGMLLIAIKVRWELHRHSWFWGTVVLIALAEIPMVVLVPWTSKWIPAIVMLPFCIVDCLAILWAIQTVEKWMAPTGG